MMETFGHHSGTVRRPRHNRRVTRTLKASGSLVNGPHNRHKRYSRQRTKMQGKHAGGGTIPKQTLWNLHTAREGRAMLRPRNFRRLLHRACGAILLCSLLAAICQRPAAAQDLSEEWETDEYQETYLYSQPIDGASLNPERYINIPERERRWLLRFRTGASYFDTNANGSRVGGLYGIDAIVPVYRQLAGYASGSANHFSQGSQYLGTVGLLKMANGYSRHRDARLGWGVLFDNFTDTRFGDPYLSQLRVNLNYALNENNTIGVTWYEPLADENAVLVAPGVTSPFFSSQVVELYGSHVFDRASISAAIGYRDQQDAVTFATHGRLALTDNVNALANAHYEDIGLWSSFIGVEVLLGTRHTGWRGRRCCRVDRRDEIVRGGLNVLKKQYDESEGEKADIWVTLNRLLGRPIYRETWWEITEYIENNSIVADYDPGAYRRNTNGPMMGDDMGGFMCPDGFIESPPDSGMCEPL